MLSVKWSQVTKKDIIKLCWSNWLYKLLENRGSQWLGTRNWWSLYHHNTSLIKRALLLHCLHNFTDSSSFSCQCQSLKVFRRNCNTSDIKSSMKYLFPVFWSGRQAVKCPMKSNSKIIHSIPCVYRKPDRAYPYIDDYWNWE